MSEDHGVWPGRRSVRGAARLPLRRRGGRELGQVVYIYRPYICRLSRVRMSETQERVLQVFLDDPTVARYGYDLMRAAKIQSGTLYPMLTRWAEEGLVESEWEHAADTERNGRPPRKFYRLTGAGVRVARLELAEREAARRAAVAGSPSGRGLRPSGGLA
jgi:PadR family transcriptional regulator, regulatory protein PadR